MTRKEFLQTVGGAAVGAAVGAAISTPSTASAAATSKIKRGVQFYSYQTLFYTGQVTLEDLIAEVSSMGAYGVEVVPEMMLPDYPNPSERFVSQWKGWMEKYHTVPDDWAGIHDQVMVDGHPLSVDGGAERLLADIKCANRLGFANMRLLGSTPLPVVEKVLPSAEKANIKLNFEIHGPNRMDGRTVEAWLRLFEKTKSPCLGLNPDMSLFEKKPVAVRRDCMIRGGALRADIAKYIDQAEADGVPEEKAVAEVTRMGGGDGDQQYLEGRYAGYQDPKKLVPLLKYAHHIHGKCYEMNEDCQETSIAYDEVIPLIVQNGYEGYIATEYEGQRFVMDNSQEDEVEQVRRHQVMLKRLLGE